MGKSLYREPCHPIAFPRRGSWFYVTYFLVAIQLLVRLVTDLELESLDLCITHIHLMSAMGLVNLIRYRYKLCFLNL